MIGFASPGKFGKFGLTFVFFLFQRQHYCKTFAVGSIHSSLYWSNAHDSGFTIKDLRSAPNEKRSTADEQQLEAIINISTRTISNLIIFLCRRSSTYDLATFGDCVLTSLARD